jgi:hypothetical protein
MRVSLELVLMEREAVTEVQITFGPKWISSSWIFSCMMHTVTTSQYQKALESRMGMLRTHSTFRVHLAADSERWN